MPKPKPSELAIKTARTILEGQYGEPYKTLNTAGVAEIIDSALIEARLEEAEWWGGYMVEGTPGFERISALRAQVGKKSI